MIDVITHMMQFRYDIPVELVISVLSRVDSSAKAILVQFDSGASLPRQLPWLIFETMIDYKKWPKQLGRFQEKNILIFLPSKKSPLINWVFFADLKK